MKGGVAYHDCAVCTKNQSEFWDLKENSLLTLNTLNLSFGTVGHYAASDVLSARKRYYIFVYLYSVYKTIVWKHWKHSANRH